MPNDNDVKIPNQPDAATQQDGDTQNQDTFFLEAGNSKYKTKEDAVKGVEESGRTIQSLTKFKETLAGWGIESPEEIDEYFEEYLTLKKEREAASGGDKKNPPAKSTQQQDKAKDGELSDNEKQLLAWMKDKAGVASRSDIEEIKEAIKALSGQQENRDKINDEQLYADAQETLAEVLVNEGLVSEDMKPEDEKFQRRVERYITAWLGEFVGKDGKTPIPNSPLARFNRGGIAMRKVINEGLQEFLGTSEQVSRVRLTKQQERKEKQVNRVNLKGGSESSPLKPKKAPETFEEASELAEKAWEGLFSKED